MHLQKTSHHFGAFKLAFRPYRHSAGPKNRSLRADLRGREALAFIPCPHTSQTKIQGLSIPQPTDLLGLRACCCPPQQLKLDAMIKTECQQRGFSLVELMIVVAIFSILAMIGFGMTRDTLPRYRASSSADQFAANVATCRMVAIRSGYECRILMSDYDDKPANLTSGNAGIYYIQIGNKSLQSDDFETLPTSLMEVQGTYNIGEGSTHYKRNVSILDWGTLSGTTGSGGDSIVFSPRGFVANPASDFDDGYITIQFVNKVSYNKGIDDIYKVQIARSGMTRIKNPLMGDRYPDDNHGSSITSSGE